MKAQVLAKGFSLLRVGVQVRTWLVDKKVELVLLNSKDHNRSLSIRFFFYVFSFIYVFVSFVGLVLNPQRKNKTKKIGLYVIRSTSNNWIW